MQVYVRVCAPSYIIIELILTHKRRVKQLIDCIECIFMLPDAVSVCVIVLFFVYALNQILF